MKFKTKGFTSLLLAMLFSVVAFSGVMLYFTPRGRMANWTGWTMLGLDKQTWSLLHINVCLMFLFVVAMHLFFNWKVLWSYIRKRSAGLRHAGGFNLKIEMLVAVLITSVVTVGTIMHSPGLTATADLNEKIKDYWDNQSSAGPAPHAEEFTLSQFADSVGMTSEDLIASLSKEGVAVDRMDATVREIAEANSITPADLFAIVRPTGSDGMSTQGRRGRGDGTGAGRGMGSGQGMGMGNGAGNGRGERQGNGQGMGRRRGLSEDSISGQ